MIAPGTARDTGRLSLPVSAEATGRADRLVSFSVALYVLGAYLVSAVPGFSRTVHVAVGLMFLALLLRSVRHGFRLRLDPVFPLAIVFLAYALSSVFWSLDQGAALVTAIGLIVDIAGAFLIFMALHNGASPLVVVGSAAVGASVQAAVALNQYLVSGASRAEGLTGNANALAIQLSGAAFLLVLVVPKARWGQLLALALIIVATLTSGSRKMLFVWFSYAILMARNLGLQLRRRTVITAGLMIGLPLFVWGLANFAPMLLGPLEELTVVQRIQGTLEGRETDVRGGLIADALEQWWQRPIVGYGIDQYRIVSKYSAYSHNNYTELLASLGVIGLLLYYTIIAVLTVRAVRGVIRGSQASWTVLAIILVLLLMDVARVSYTARSTWLLIAMMAFYVGRVAPDPKPTA